MIQGLSMIYWEFPPTDITGKLQRASTLLCPSPWAPYLYDSITITIKTTSSSMNVITRDFKIQRGGRQRERKKNNRFYKKNNNFARASRFFVHFFAVFVRLRHENA